MKLFFSTLVLALAGWAPVFSQGSAADQDPLLGNHTLGNAAELCLVWTESNSGGSSTVTQTTYRYVPLNNPDPLVQDSLRVGSLQADSGSFGASGDFELDAASGDFNGDGRADVAALWEGENRSIVMIVPGISPGTLGWSSSNAFVLADTGSLPGQGFPAGSQVRIVPGNFDDDSQDELVVAYWGDDEMIHLSLYDMNGTLSPVLLSTAEPVFMKGRGSNLLERSARFDVIAGDLDGDDIDEIVLAWVVEGSCGSPGDCWQLMTRVYDVSAGGATVSPKGEVAVYSKLNSASDYLDRLGIVAGGFDDTYGDEVCVVYRVGNNNGTDYEYLQPLAISPAFDTLTADQGRRSTIRTGQTLTGDPVTVEAADLDADGRAEVVVLTGQLQILEPDETLPYATISVQSVAEERGRGGRRAMVVADLDADNAIAHGDTIWRPEIIVVSNLQVNSGVNPDDEFLIDVYEYVPGQFNMRKRGSLRDGFTDFSGRRPFAVVAGDFDGTAVRVGTPHRYTKTDIVQPLIILNAPPTHFDLFDGTPYDVNGCYNQGMCDFVTTYSTVTQTSTNVEATFNRDWSVGAEVSGGFTIPLIDVGVDATLKTRYGEGFSRVTGSTTSFTVSQSIDARGDDFIYATIVDYDVWEYPLYADNALQGYLAVVIPGLKTRAWFPSKSPTATEYIPAHEVGNIFSYKDVASPGENSALEEAVRWDTGDRITLNNFSGFTWSLTREQDTVTQTQNRTNRSIGADVSFDIPFKFLPDVEVSGDYGTSTVSTTRISVRDQKGLTVHLGAINQTFGETYYSVQPYAYWAKSGPLVVDYAVKPELSQSSPTWWQERYGALSDPAFILPWRYDPEKGNVLSEEQKRYQTKDIVITPTGAKVGDIVTITARIQNFSLVPTPLPVTARFYLGNPADGGTLIRGISGDSVVSTGSGLAARGTALVELQWEVPSSVGLNPRIYAVLDQEGAIEEIHETNNVGWVTFFINGTAAAVGETGGIPTAYALGQNYPNPFNPSTSIRFSLPERQYVALTVYDLMGRSVARLVEGVMAAGTHTVDFDAGGLSSGVYFYRLTTPDFVATRKLIVMK